MVMENKNRYLPEGSLLYTPENQAATASVTALMQAQADGMLLEGRAVRCDVEHNLYVQLPCGEGIIPHVEGAAGIAEGVTKDIVLITRVNKAVCFVVTGFEQTEEGCRPILSRRIAQERCREEFIDRLQPGDVIPARITRLETFGAFCDIGCGLPALLPIADISVSRISHPKDRFTTGMESLGIVSSLENGRICLSHRELLGTWEENAALFEAGGNHRRRCAVGGALRNICGADPQSGGLGGAPGGGAGRAAGGGIYQKPAAGEAEDQAGAHRRPGRPRRSPAAPVFYYGGAGDRLGLFAPGLQPHDRKSLRPSKRVEKWIAGAVPSGAAPA